MTRHRDAETQSVALYFPPKTSVTPWLCRYSQAPARGCTPTTGCQGVIVTCLTTAALRLPSESTTTRRTENVCAVENRCRAFGGLVTEHCDSVFAPRFAGQ